METIALERGGIMISINQLQRLSAADFDLNNKASLVDIKTVNINTALNKSDRISKYINAVNNPYLFRVGDTAVRVRYGNGKENNTLQDSVVNILSSS